jgi:uncharacterized small protein (TIGR04563 family)
MPGDNDLMSYLSSLTVKAGGNVGRPRTSNPEGTPSNTSERKQSIYFKGDLLEQMKAESARLDRSLSWVVAECVRRALPELQGMADVSDPE